MNIPQAIILAIVEGITEFLPISSTGHLILASDFMGIAQTEFVKSFHIAIQLGAILAIAFLYWKTLVQDKVIWTKIILAFIPSGILGVVLYRLIKTYLFGNDMVVVLALFFGGIALILAEYLLKPKATEKNALKHITYKDAFIIGLCQTLAMIPGVSRAASTIVGGMFLGLSRTAAAEFSFLLALPTMFAATVLDLSSSSFAFSSDEFTVLAVGFVGAFITALITVRIFLHFVQKHNFVPFGIYRIVVAIIAYFVLVQ